jgi:hypothetical protein
MKKHHPLLAFLVLALTALAVGQHPAIPAEDSGKLDGNKPTSGFVEDGQYKNDFFGFKYQLPSGFESLASPEVSKFNYGHDSFTLLEAHDYVHRSVGKKASGMVKIAAFRASSIWGPQWQQKSGQDYLRNRQTRMSSFEKFDSIKTREIGGRRFYEMYSKTNPEIPIPQGVHKNLATVEKGFVLNFILQAATEQELEEIDRSLDSIVSTAEDRQGSPRAPAIHDDKKPDAGSFLEGQYKNDFFGFTYTVPPTFKAATLPPTVSKAFDGKNSFVLLVVGDYAHPQSATKASGSVKITAHTQASLWGAAWQQKTGEDYLRKLRTMMFTVEPVGPIRQRKIAGRTFYELDGKSNPKAPIPQGVQKNVVIVEKGFVLSFILEAGTQQELDEVDRSLESIAF